MPRPPITPEEARELLEAATPGPWETSEDRLIGEVVVRSAGYRTKTGGLWCVVEDGAPGYGDPMLLASAPDLAAIVAGLRVEYAAQVRRGTASPWLYVLQNGHFSKRGSTSVWCKKRKGCDNAIRSALKRKDVGADTVEFRIVARYVSETWEVDSE